MFRNYFKMSLRSITRNKFYSGINIFGLSLGLACCIVIFLFVQYEFSFDGFHENADRIFRLTSTRRMPVGEVKYAFTDYVYPQLLKQEYPEIEDFIRIDNQSNALLDYSGRKFEVDLMFAEHNFFKFFSFNLLQGNPANVLADPDSIVLTKDTADKLFRNEDPLDKVLKIIFRNNESIYRVAGIAENPPDNSHIKFQLIIPYVKYAKMMGEDYKNEESIPHAYLLMKEKSDVKNIETKLRAFLAKHEKSKELFTTAALSLQPLTSIHLHSNLGSELEPNSNVKYSLYLSLLAFFIMVIACFNFMNLTSARAFSRAKEVGTRKVIGANRWQIAKQFFVEAVLLSLMAVCFSYIVSDFLLNFFNGLTGLNLQLDFAANYILFPLSFLLAFCVGVFSGSYPAILLSSFNPIEALKNRTAQGSNIHFVRKLLVVTQFSITIIFITCTLIILKQMSFMKNRDLGFNRENIIEISGITYWQLSQIKSFKEQLLSYPNIVLTSGSSISPVRDRGSGFPVKPEGYEGEKIRVSWSVIDHNFLPMFNLKIIEGRNFNEAYSKEKFNVIINKAAAKAFGWEEPLGKKIIYTPELSRTVVGVVEDFHFETLRKAVRPLIFLYSDNINLSHIFIKISKHNISQSISLIGEVWNKFFPDNDFVYRFVDEQIEIQYKEETRIGKIISFASILTIIIASLGLLGLIAFSVEKKTKEVGIRKVLGSSVLGVCVLLCKDFIKLIIVANIFAWPIAYYFMRNWLNNFAYRIDLEIKVFILSGIIALIIALCTVSYHVIKAASKDPVESLRYE